MIQVNMKLMLQLTSKQQMLSVLPLSQRFQYVHSSKVLLSTHDYKQEEVLFSQNKLSSVLQASQTIFDIRDHTGTDIRLQEKSDTDEEGTAVNKFLVVGTSAQRKSAIELLQAVIDGRDTPTMEKASQFKDEKLVWHGYKRNYKGQYAPLKPRRKCIRCGGKLLSGNPCPLCQMKINSNYDVYYTDINILKQFICPHTWNVLDPYVTNICRQQHRAVEAAIIKARKFGYIPFTLPLHSDEPRKHAPAGVPTDRKIKVKMH